jgi:hypothetical protein
MAILSILPQLVTPAMESAVGSVVLGGMGGAALGLGAVAVADYLYRLGGFVSVIRSNPETQAALTLVERTIQRFRDAANAMVSDAQTSDDDRLKLQRALLELERREALRMRAERGEQQAIVLLEQMRERKRPLEQYPDPGDPRIEELIEQPARRQRTLEGPMGSQPALEDAPVEGSGTPAPPTRPRGSYRISEEQRTQMMNEMARGETDADPSRETRRGLNTDYAMENGLTLRFHQGQSVWVELRSPTGVIGTLAKLDNALTGDKSADILLRQRIYDQAKRLQPSSMEKLAAIRDTIQREAQSQAPQRPFPMTPPATPRPGAPVTPFPKAAPPSPAVLGTQAKSAARPELRRSASRNR